MSDFIPKAGGVKVGGLSRKAQKLQSLREKTANASNGTKPGSQASATGFKAKESFTNTRKPSFQRKSV